MHEKLTIIDSKHVGKQRTPPTKNAPSDLYDFTLCQILFYHIWHIERYVFLPVLCGLASPPFRLQRSCSLQYVYASVSVSMPLVSAVCFPNLSLSLLQLTFKNSAIILRKLYF